MTYGFIQKAKKQPDLADVVDYLAKPLSILEEILQRYEEISVTDKVKVENIEIYHKTDKILNKHLPSLINNYCQFSFQYRNTETIKSETRNGTTVSYTAKDLLLNDIAKLIEEVNIIETEFNETNRFYALVQSRIMANMGHTPETLAQQPEKKVVLENKFIYEKEVIQESIPQYEEVFTKKIEKPQVETTGNFGLLEIIMVLNIIIVVVAFGLFQLSGVMETNKAKTTVSQLNTITEFARHFYTAPLHGPISTKSFVESGLIPNAGLKDNAFVGEFGTIQVVEAENQTYKIVLDNVPSKSCHYIPLKFENTTSVVVDDTAIHNNKVDTQRLTDACAGDSHKMEFYVPKEKYLK